MSTPEMTEQIHALYAAFNRRDSSFVIDRMTPDVTWPRAFKGGFVTGQAAVQAYWEDQWSDIDPHVEPTSVTVLEDGSVDVEVHQVVRDLSGALIADDVVHHIYAFDDDVIAGMEIQEAGSSAK